MNLNEILNYELLSLGTRNVTVGNLILALCLLIGLAFLYRSVIGKWLPIYLRKEDVQGKEKQRTRRLVQFCFFLLAIITIMISTGLDYRLYPLSGEAIEQVSGTEEGTTSAPFLQVQTN